MAPFGGVGLMIDRPQTFVRVEPGERFAVRTPAVSEQLDRGQFDRDKTDVEQRVLSVTRRFCQQFAADFPELPAVTCTVFQRPAAHTGLGTGTQLALAIASCLCQLLKPTFATKQIIQTVAGRGARSGVGNEGFFSGGMIVDTSPVRAIDFPSEWTMVLLQPQVALEPVAGLEESQRFSQLPVPADSHRRSLMEGLQRLVTAVEQQNFAEFSEAVYQYNHRSGELFKASQGGAYNGAEVTRLITQLREMGIQGVGQSSWGPTVFACFPKRSDAEKFCQFPPAASSTATLVTAQPIRH